jgi:hypothetical protein
MGILCITLFEIYRQYPNEHGEPKVIEDAKQNHHDELYLADQVEGCKLGWVCVVEEH